MSVESRGQSVIFLTDELVDPFKHVELAAQQYRDLGYNTTILYPEWNPKDSFENHLVPLKDVVRERLKIENSVTVIGTTKLGLDAVATIVEFPHKQIKAATICTSFTITGPSGRLTPLDSDAYGYIADAQKSGKLQATRDTVVNMTSRPGAINQILPGANIYTIREGEWGTPIMNAFIDQTPVVHEYFKEH